MARKQLADLIKEEVGKSTNGRDGGTGVQPLQQDSTSAESDSAQASTSNSPDQDQDNGDQKSAGTAKRRRSPTKADLEATVADLTAQLEAAQSTEANHQEQVAQLQQAFAQQIDTLKAELAEAKSTILQLVDNNANAKTLQEQVQSLQTELAQEKEKVTALQQDVQQVETLKSELQKAQKRITQLAPSQAPARKLSSFRPPAKPMRAASRTTPLSLGKSKSSPSPTVPSKEQPNKFLSTESKFKRMRKASIDRKQPESDLSDTEIGWFD